MYLLQLSVMRKTFIYDEHLLASEEFEQADLAVLSHGDPAVPAAGHLQGSAVHGTLHTSHTVMLRGKVLCLANSYKSVSSLDWNLAARGNAKSLAAPAQYSTIPLRSAEIATSCCAYQFITFLIEQWNSD